MENPLTEATNQTPYRRQRAPKGRGSVYQRADGRWEGRLPDARDGSGSRRRQSVYAHSRSEAARKLAEALVARTRGMRLPDQKTVLGDYLTAWLDRMRAEVRPTTWRRYEGAVRVLIAPRIGGTPVGRLGLALVQGMINDVAAIHGIRSAGIAHAVLRKALADAERAQAIPRNVAKDARPPEHRRQVPAPWSLSDGRSFLGHLRTVGHRDEALYMTAMTMGLRQGELLALVWEDVDLDACRLTVSGTLTWVRGRPYIGAPKSEAGRRTVAIPAHVAMSLRAWRERQEGERAVAGSEWRNDGLVFAKPDGRARRGDVLTHSFHHLTASRALPSIRFHDLRRFAAVLLLTGSGGDVVAAGAALGHSRKSSLAADVYGYLPPEIARRLAADAEHVLWTAEAPGGYAPNR